MTDLPAATTVPLHLSVDPFWDLVAAVEFGRVDDGLPEEQWRALEEDERVLFLLAAPDCGPVVGFTAGEPSELDLDALAGTALFTGPRFDVPTLGLTQASAGEILLAVRARFEPDEPTAGAMHFHAAIGGGIEDVDELVVEYRLALEAGEMKAMFGLGYALVDAGRPREAYDHLRRYTELTPHNSWAWYHLGRACWDLGEHREAARCFVRAARCEDAGSFETDALAQLDLLEVGFGVSRLDLD